MKFRSLLFKMKSAVTQTCTHPRTRWFGQARP